MLALFDMDGTLFPGDSQLRFAGRILSRHPWRRLYLLLLLPCALLTALRIIRTERMKRIFLSYLYRMPLGQVEREAQAFAEENIRPILYPGVLQRLRDHQAAGDRCILVSASPSFYTEHIGRMLGFDDIIATPIVMQPAMPLVPAIEPPGNNKGGTKLIRLRKKGIIPSDGKTPDSICYTDSRADLPMLSVCEQGVLVNPSEQLANQAPEHHWQIIRQPLPWHGKRAFLAFILKNIIGFRA